MAEVTVIQSSANVAIDKSDIVAIQVAKAERVLNTALNNAVTAMKDCEQACQSAEAALEASYTHSAKEAIAADLEVLAGLSATYTGLKASYSGHFVNETDLQISLKLSDNGYQHMEIHKTVPLTPTQLTQRQQLEGHKQALADAQRQVVLARQKLTKLPTLERQYRAALAEKMLAGTAEGQQILAALNGDIQQDILALPLL